MLVLNSNRVRLVHALSSKHSQRRAELLLRQSSTDGVASDVRCHIRRFHIRHFQDACTCTNV